MTPSLLSKLPKLVSPAELLEIVLARGVAAHLNSTEALKQYFLNFIYAFERPELSSMGLSVHCWMGWNTDSHMLMHVSLVSILLA
jgi:hypothetical protein